MREIVKEKTSTRDFSKAQEIGVAKDLSGKVVANSGAGKWRKGDVLTKKFLVECKTKMKDSLSFLINKEWIAKNREEAIGMRKPYSAIAIQFEPDGDNYYLIDSKLFKRLIEIVEEDE